MSEHIASSGVRRIAHAAAASGSGSTAGTQTPAPGRTRGLQHLHLPDSEVMDQPVGLPLGHRIANLVLILLPLVGFILAMAWSLAYGLHWAHVVLFAVMYLLTGFGVTVGYHRYFTHKSFETGPVVTTILGICGSMSVEGSILRWVAFHRCHHQHSDTEHDPHSPHAYGEGLLNIFRGFINAHVGWLMRASDKGLGRYVTDLRRDRLTRTLSAMFPVWALLGLAIPAVLGGLLTWSWTGVFLGFLWGGLVRILLVHHVTWSVNSICHLWGSRPFRSHDESRNNPIVGLLALGEGWHNNHHAFPTSARHGLRWWEVDLSWMLIRLMEKFGLVWNVKVPGKDHLDRKRSGIPSSPAPVSGD